MAVVKIIVATHKNCKSPDNDIFIPIQVGKKNATVKLEIQGDDTGENISEKNATYCEMTALYWAWKNMDNLDYIGLCHYRRYFNFRKNRFFQTDKTKLPITEVSNIQISEKEIVSILTHHDIILTSPLYYPHDIKFDYCYAHIPEDFTIMEEVIKNKFKEYGTSFDKVFKQNKLSHYNMFITNQKIFSDYSEWVFAVLAEIEKSVKLSEYPAQRRVIGYLSERLLMLYCYHHKLRIKYLPIYFLEESNTENESYFRYMLRNLKYQVLFVLGKIGSKR